MIGPAGRGSATRSPMPVEQRGFGGGHPHLAAAFEAGEQRGAALGIEVGGDLVEQEDRRLAAPLGDQFGVGEDQAEQQRLLLAGRGLRGRHLLGAVEDRQVLAVRALGGPAGRGVARAIGAERRSEVAGLPAFQRDRGAGEFVVGRIASRSSSAPTVRVARRRRSPRRARPSPAPATAARPRPSARRRAACCGRASPLRSGTMVRVAGLQREHEAVEEAPPFARAAGEQAVHRRRQPQHRQPFAKRVDRGGRAVDPDLPPLGRGRPACRCR